MTAAEMTDTIIARRNTADGKMVCLWVDGSLTWALGSAVRGAWMSPPAGRREVALRSGWLVLGELEVYDAAEVPDLARAARWAAERDGTPGTMRARMHRGQPGLVPRWTVLETRRDGTPSERVWVLPRIGKHAGTAVFDLGGGRRYHVMHRVSRDGTYAPTGCCFSTVREVIAHLLS